MASLLAMTEMDIESQATQLATTPHPISEERPPITYIRRKYKNPKTLQSPVLQELDDEEEDDERKEKKVRLIHKLSDRKQKLKINAISHGYDDAGLVEKKKVGKWVEAAGEGSSILEFGPTKMPLPDRKLLISILDNLQNKDTFGAFAEPVDIDVLPDYYDIVQHPMDFATVRKKLDDGAYYKSLEDFEVDVLQICLNAMLYNAPNTVYYRQARAIEEFAKQEFEILRLRENKVKPQPKVVRRGRPRRSKKQEFVQQAPADVAGTEHPSVAAPADIEERGMGSNPYNLRKGPVFSKYRSSDIFDSSYKPRRGQNSNPIQSSNWNNEFPVFILKADTRRGRSKIIVDETRRDTYDKSLSQASTSLVNYVGHTKELVLTGLENPFDYARSLARFSGNLGPEVWKFAAQKIKSVLPPGVPFGPGWVGQIGAYSQPDCVLAEPTTTPVSIPLHNHIVPQVSRPMYGNVVPTVCLPPTTNYTQPEQTNVLSAVHLPAAATIYTLSRQVNVLSTFHVPPTANYTIPAYPTGQRQFFDPRVQAEMWQLGGSSGLGIQILQQQQQQQSYLVPGELGLRIPVSSSSIQTSSGEEQPDLALQL